MDYQSLQFLKAVKIEPAPVAGGLSVISLPVGGPTYYGVAFRYKANGVNATEATMKADIKWVRVKLGEVALIELSGKHLIDVFNKYYGIQSSGMTAGQFYLPLARPWLKNPESVENTAWGTQNVEKLTVEVEFAGTAVTPVLETHLIYSVYKRDLGVVIEAREFVYQSAVAGPQEFENTLKSRGDIVALHVDHGGIVNSCDIEINNQIYTQGQDLSLFQEFVKWFSLRAPQTNYIHFEGQMRGLLSDAIPIMGTSNFRIKPNFTAAGAITFIQETLNVPLGAARKA